MAGVRLSIGRVLLAAAVAAPGLYGCGRAGPLELPPGPATPAAQMSSSDAVTPLTARNAAAERNGFDAQGNPVATPGVKKPFILDPLLQ